MVAHLNGMWFVVLVFHKDIPRDLTRLSLLFKQSNIKGFIPSIGMLFHMNLSYNISLAMGEVGIKIQ